MAGDAVRIEGYADLRRDLRAMPPAIRRELPKALKTGAQLLLPSTKSFTARRTGRTAAEWRAAAAGNTAYLRNRKPWAGVLEFGGTIQPKGTPFEIRAHPAGTRALELKQQQVVDTVADAIDGVAARHGWKGNL